MFKTNTVLYPAAYINVNPGSQADPSLSAGSMQLNGVLCQQIPTNLALSHVWLSYYWNCSNPSGPSGVDSNVPFSANLLDIGLRDKFAANSPLPVQLYVMNNITDVNNFFANTRPPLVPLPEGTLGITYYSNNGYGQSAIVEMVNGTPRDSGLIVTTTNHELGHEADFRNLSQSSTAQYNNLAERDFAQLDYIDVDAQTPVLRDPCVDYVEPGTGQTTVAPFAGVNDQSGDAVCDLVSTKYSGMKNSQILRAQTDNLVPNANLG